MSFAKFTRRAAQFRQRLEELIENGYCLEEKS